MGLLSSAGTINGEPAKILFDDGALANFISSTFAKRLGIPTEVSTEAALMPDGNVHNLTSTKDPLEIATQEYTDNTYFAVCPLAAYDVILGKKWHEDYNVRKKYRTNVITFLKDGRRLRINAALELSKTIWSKHKLAQHIKRRNPVFAIFLRPQVLHDSIGLNSIQTASASTDKDIQDVLAEYQDVFPDDLPKGLPPDRGRPPFKIELTEEAEPHKKGIYRLSEPESQELLRQIRDLIEKGFIQPSTSPWGAPVLFAAKKDGGLRLCIDYRALNKQTVKNCYPLPRIDEIFDSLRQATLFTTLDLRSGYHQIRLDPESIPLTAFRTRYGLFEFLVVPFGLTNAPATFMNLVNDILRPYIDNFVSAYLDDILIFSKTRAEHIRHLRQVLDKLREHKLYAKVSKCKFAQRSVDFLGHVVSANGFEMERVKVEAIKKWPKPKTKRDVQSFLGMLNFYRRFIEKMATVAKPLTELTSIVDFEWTARQEDAFNSLKDKVMSAPILRAFNPELPVVLSTDASGCAVGAVLEQDDGMGRRPVAFFSQTLSIHEQRYTIRERELLAIVQAIRHWRCYLHGRQFIVHTDHESLRYLRTQDKLNDRQVRWLEMLEQYDFKIIPVPGTRNPVADALSRNTELAESRIEANSELLTRVIDKALPPTIDGGVPKNHKDNEKPKQPKRKATTNSGTATTTTRHKEPEDATNATEDPKSNDPTREPLKNPKNPTKTQEPMKPENEAQPINTVFHLELNKEDQQSLLAAYAEDPEFKEILKKPTTPFKMDGCFIIRYDHVCIPKGRFRDDVLHDYHDIPSKGHMGLRKTTKDLVTRFYWKTMRQDIKDYVQSCDACQRFKSTTQAPLGLLQPLEPPTRPWQSISMDFITPLPLTARGHNGLLVVVDRHSKMIRLAPTEPETSAKHVAQLFHDHVYRTFGLPIDIVCDRDRIFMSQFWRGLLDKINVKIRPSSSYHPQTDGQTEVMNKKVEEVLRCFVDHNQRDWDLYLTNVEVAYNHSINSVTTYSPFYLTYGYEPNVVPFDTLRSPSDKVPALAEWLATLRQSHKTAADAIRKANAYRAQYVNKSRRDCHLSVGDLVMLSTKNLMPESFQGARKLMPKYSGPYKITEVVTPVTFRLDLPQAVLDRKVHNAFHASLVKPYHADTRFGRSPNPPPAITLSDGTEAHEVERVLQHRTRRGRSQYLVKWKGYHDTENSWVREQDIDAAELITAFNSSRRV